MPVGTANRTPPEGSVLGLTESELDETYATIMEELVATGVAPHYAELAPRLQISPAEALRRITKILEITPGWMHPGTDYIASFPPFNNQPTPYRISVDGQQQWFAQCGFEALACCWLFPGQLVEIDAPCLLRDKPIHLEMRDGELLLIEPETVVGYTRSRLGMDEPNQPFR